MIKKIIVILMIFVLVLIPICSVAITETDNGIMAVYIRNSGMNSTFEMGRDLKGFDVKGYIDTPDGVTEKTLISSTFEDHGYHVFLNVNGSHGEMSGKLQNTDKEKLKAMQYTAYDPSNEWQTIDGIDLKVTTQFINDGEQLQIIYDLKNTTDTSATFSLGTAADVQIDDDDEATIERLEDATGVKLWTDQGETGKAVQFVFYGNNVEGTTAVDNIWIGEWDNGTYLANVFNNNSDVNIIENKDSAFAFSWTNRTINAGQSLTYSVLMEVGDVNKPNTGITLDDNTKFYYKDVKINGTIIDSDLRDTITVHYVVDETEYTLPEITTTGSAKNFTLDLTPLNLEAVTPHTIKVWGTDSIGSESNIEERTFIITYVKEPVATLSTTDWAKDVTFKITDDINETEWVDTYQYRLNDGDWIDCSKDTDIPIQESGNVKVDIRIQGTYTGDYSNIVTLNAKVDKVNPTKIKPTATKTTNSITLNSRQTDEHSGIDTTETMYAINKDGTWSDWQSSNSFTGLTHNTEYLVKTKAVDNVGNISESEELTVKTDELLLGNLILKLNNSNGNNYTENTWTNQNIYVAIEERTVGATTKFKSKENSVQTISETNQETTVTTSGTTTLTLSVTDGTNTITSDVEYVLKIDKIAPVINELSLDNQEWANDSRNITGKAIDSLSGIIAYQFSNRGDLTSASSGWIDITSTNNEITQTKEVAENGKVYFYVKDVAGNIASVGIDTKIDLQGPIINFSRANGKTTINVTDTGSGIKNIQYAWTTENTEPTQWEDYSSAVTYTGTSKERIYLWARATDNANNITTSSNIFSALKKPNIISENEFINKNISFKLTSETEDTDVLYQFKINDGEWQNITKDSIHTITNITEGTVSIEARILDNAGRYSEVASKNVKVSKVETPKEPTTPQDKTISDGKFPNTGTAYFMIIVSTVLLIGISLIIYKKFNYYKDIK